MDKFTRKVGEMTDAAGQRVDHEQTKRRLDQIEDAVGRPVTKVMLDLEDRVILDLGDLITHAAVQRAHDAGALDSLLASVFKGEVAFERDEMRAEGRRGNPEVASGPGISALVLGDLRPRSMRPNANARRKRRPGRPRRSRNVDRARQSGPNASVSERWRPRSASRKERPLQRLH